MQIPVFLSLGSMKGASLSVVLMEEGMKCGEDGSPLLKLFCAVNVSPLPTVNTYICHARFPQGDSGTLVLSGSPAPLLLESRLSPGRELWLSLAVVAWDVSWLDSVGC